ncbi:MAG: DUF456 domain-containing protein [Anaeromyxobacteraceae bacterium]
MEIALYVLGFALVAVGVAGLVLPAIPGAVLVFAGAVVVAWAEHFTRVGWLPLTVIGLLCAAVWAVDFAAGALGAKVFGASGWSILGAGVGTIVGLFFGLPGILLGPAIGAIAFEYARNPDMKRAAKAGAGAFLGFVLGSAAKVAIAFVAIGVLVLALVF